MIEAKPKLGGHDDDPFTKFRQRAESDPAWFETWKAYYFNPDLDTLSADSASSSPIVDSLLQDFKPNLQKPPRLIDKIRTRLPLNGFGLIGGTVGYLGTGTWMAFAQPNSDSLETRLAVTAGTIVGAFALDLANKAFKERNRLPNPLTLLSKIPTPIAYGLIAGGVAFTLTRQMNNVAAANSFSIFVGLIAGMGEFFRMEESWNYKKNQ